MPDNVAELHSNLELLARGIKRALERCANGRAEWIEGTVDAAIKLAAARTRFTAHRAFGQWCEENGIGNQVLKKNDRAALLEMAARPDELRAMLEASARNSIRTFHTEEWRVRFPSVGITPPSRNRQPREQGRQRRNATGRSRPQEDRAREAVRERVVAGEPVRARSTAEEIGASHVMVEQAAAMERARLELLQELNVDPATLSMSAQARLDVATRRMEQRLSAEHAARMRQLDEEVRQRVVAEGTVYRERMEAREREAEETVARYRRIIADHRFALTATEWGTLLMIAHDDPNVTVERRQEAARILIERKERLTGRS